MCTVFGLLLCIVHVIYPRPFAVGYGDFDIMIIGHFIHKLIYLYEHFDSLPFHSETIIYFILITAVYTWVYILKISKHLTVTVIKRTRRRQQHQLRVDNVYHTNLHKLLLYIVCWKCRMF